MIGFVLNGARADRPAAPDVVQGLLGHEPFAVLVPVVAMRCRHRHPFRLRHAASLPNSPARQVAQTDPQLAGRLFIVGWSGTKETTRGGSALPADFPERDLILLVTSWSSWSRSSAKARLCRCYPPRRWSGAGSRNEGTPPRGGYQAGCRAGPAGEGRATSR